MGFGGSRSYKNTGKSEYGEFLAGTPQLVIENSDVNLRNLNEEIEKIISTTEFKKYILSRPANRDSDLEQQVVRNAEKAREPLRNLPTDKRRKDFLIDQDYVILARKIMETYKVTDDYARKISELEKLGNLLMIRYSSPVIKSTQDKIRFMQEFPLFYTHRTLISFRDRDLKRPINANDNIDIMGYVVPIIYFHYVVGENYFMTLTHQAKLDRLFNTVICKSLSELTSYLKKFIN